MRLLVVVLLVCAAAPAFGFGLPSEAPTATAGMGWLGLSGLALAGSRGKPSLGAEPSPDG